MDGLEYEEGSSLSEEDEAMKISSIAQINIIKQQHSIIYINYHSKLFYDMHETLILG